MRMGGQLQNEHGIAEGVEAVFLSDGFGVGLEDEVTARRRRRSS